jgi:hypothetical protein
MSVTLINGIPQLMIAGSVRGRLLLLRALYVLVGDTVRSHRPTATLAPLIADASKRCVPLRHWADTSRRLIAGEVTYDYNEWGLMSSLANAEREWFDAGLGGA